MAGTTGSNEDKTTKSSVNRRTFITATGTAVGVAAVGAGTVAYNRQVSSESEAAADEANIALQSAIVPFDGKHQAGIATGKQAYVNLIGFNLEKGTGKTELINLLRLWTEDARELCTAETPLGSLEPEMVAIPANLTITCGLGEGFFKAAGLSDKKPSWLRDIKEYERDELKDEWSQTDIILQICSDDSIMNAHAMRHMIRASQKYVRVFWVQQGFGNAHGSTKPGETQRNLFGQLDGTINPRSEQELSDVVWLGDDEPKWAQGGTAMVLRRIRMNLDTWEMLDRNSRENSVGRRLDNGAPLTGGVEHDVGNFDELDKYGLPVIDPNSHMARARPPRGKPEQRLLRRPFNYDLPPDYKPSKDGEVQLSNSGLLFICFQKDPSKQFEPIQERLDEIDSLNEWITHIGSSVYFIPPGTTASSNTSDAPGADHYWAQSLLEG